ncbi:type I-C CRISPR-associated protein Cas8c/Csd1 [Acidisoma cellulosilytica]|uniref:Type I-C CRISPR-associated protein Cas8c/Csd1 n=1 Tax=Acidisoma cellulosilyticum TaxID=2802395 RepID=A0A963YY92_9PROT|nr:type I-C CRISPR-associated protein Cas8c/Csd1 [Acidisoma cellulosilyticum]MCB8879379.1 type I-C CRISPR-associated protein Cas8c/Csd1 [Acidisoma cellulosilyticum]
MTILQSLARRYDRQALVGEAPVPGFGPAQISFTIVLNQDGAVVSVDDERLEIGKKRLPKVVEAPQAPNDRRGEKIVSGTFWDPTDYALGIPRPDKSGSPAAIEKLRRKAVEKHSAFKERHRMLLAKTDDIGCRALLRFLESWTPNEIGQIHNLEGLPGSNVVFRLQGDNGFIHDRQAARDALLAEASGEGMVTEAMCLVTGRKAPIARLHPPIKGISEKLAPLVSFNEKSFDSYGHSQGDNAPVSQAAAFAYGTALNALLTAKGQDSKGRPRYPNRVMLGETTTAFWAEFGDAESLMRRMIAGGEEEEEDPDGGLPADEGTETTKLRDVMKRLEDGLPLTEASAGTDLKPETRSYVLGLSPNAARLSVRFWYEQSLGDFTANFQTHWSDLRLDPSPRFWPPPLWALLRDIAPQRKSENIPPNLSGEVMRAILTGLPYPRSLLVQTIMRIRADQDQEDRRTGRALEKVSDLRVALLKACLARMYRWNQIAEDVPVSIDLTTTNPAYRLGRLFSVLERLQGAALGQRNATVRDRFYASASATPALVFPSLIRNARNHSKTIRTKVGAGLAEWFEDHIAEIVSGLDGSFPKTLPLEDQGRFALGYYHQRDVFRRKKDVPPEIEAAEANADTSPEGE